ncbi:ABC transporter permease [Modestobacter sp. I12A-02628]|uniref:Transport permease protein n=1 Tax=Goekera deserti TaxID=2497753 RepID=A0A7K3WCH4_9ACTN|nr:ABC transporter permease [Goekera deserti]MPQ98589.1 ABC transporter permease [Goekera deserti]NDI49041.1 ABC transporter permease [Goekera deserti]NEL54168.1 ABC transporter permease [Goekera deserti]
MTATVPPPSADRASRPAGPRPSPPPLARISWARVGLELRLFARDRQQVVFSFAYPVVMMVVFGSVLGGDDSPGGVPFPQYFLAGIAATGIMLTSFQALATSIAVERESGQLERLQLVGTPPVAYFAGKAGQVLVTTVAQVALLLPVARYGYDVPMPADAGRWLTFAWVAVLGALAGTVVGIAASALPGSAASVGTGVSAVAVVLQFFSGVFFAFSELPEWMQTVAGLFPLKWMTQGMRSVFLPDEAAAFESGGGWDHAGIALTLAAWAIIGVVICARTFRWRQGRE